MIQLHEQITVERPALDCFLYLADLRTLVEWDQSVRRVSKLSRGPIGKGTNFKVVVTFARFPLTMTYTVTQHVPGKRIVITGRSFLLTVTDTIDFAELNLSFWNTSNVVSMQLMFLNYGKFYKPWEQLVERERRTKFTSMKYYVESSGTAWANISC